jgi:hypothetical protein
MNPFYLITVKPVAIQLLIEHNSNVNLPVYNMNYPDKPGLLKNNLTPLHFFVYYIEEKTDKL